MELPLDITPLVIEEAVADLALGIKEDLAMLVTEVLAAGDDAAAIDVLLQSAANGMVGYLISGMLCAADAGIDLGCAAEEAKSSETLQ